MKNILYLISNEKISQNDEMLFCDNLDMKSTPEGLNKHFDVKVFARKSKVKRSLRLNLKSVKIFSNIFSYVFNFVFCKNDFLVSKSIPILFYLFVFINNRSVFWSYCFWFKEMG